LRQKDQEFGGEGVREGAEGKGGEMTQTLYARMNKIKIKIIKIIKYFTHMHTIL
jgi:hypothetical protein